MRFTLATASLLLLGACASHSTASESGKMAGAAPSSADALFALTPLAEVPSPSLAEAAVTLLARWVPMASSKYDLAESSPELAALYAAGPAEPERAWSSSSFAFLLPPEGAEPGATWPLDARPCLPLLRQFHPGATLDLHHGFGAQEGAAATLLASSPERLDVLFRVHAEIEAVPGELYYTPSQFEGRLVWDRIAERVLAFELAVPPRDTNVDVNALVDTQIQADIGFAPEMSLRMDRASAPEERDLAEPRRALRRALYGGFSDIDWLPLETAAQRARAEKRPLHVLILFGTLDDESC